jgi:hypothetical protein
MNRAACLCDLSWRPGRRVVCALLLAGFVFAASPEASARPAFAILSIATHLEQGVYYLDTHMRLDLNQRARKALDNGVALDFRIPIHITHRRLWLWNVVVAHLTERYRLRYFPLTDNYRIANLNSGAHHGFDTLAAALAAIGDIRHLPLIDASLLDPHTRYYIAVRVVLDTKKLPGPLKVAAEVVPGWQLASQWRAQRLKP